MIIKEIASAISETYEKSFTAIKNTFIAINTNFKTLEYILNGFFKIEIAEKGNFGDAITEVKDQVTIWDIPYESIHRRNKDQDILANSPMHIRDTNNDIVLSDKDGASRNFEKDSNGDIKPKDAGVYL